MIDVSATRFKNNFFHYLDQVEQGETINLIRNKVRIATIVSAKSAKWQDQMTLSLRSQFESMDLTTPVEDIWEEYV